MSACLAELSGIHKRYKQITALDGLDLRVRAGELLAVLGPNGAGKTTAISILLGLQMPESGSARLFGRPPQDIAARRNIGVMMQDVALPHWLRVHELVQAYSSYYPDPYDVELTLRLAGIQALAARAYGTLSGGQKRQVQFAIAICGRPALLFLDEPTVALDIHARQSMWSSMRDLIQRGCSIVLTTHYIEEAEALANRVVILLRGKVIANGSVDEMRALVNRTNIRCRTVLSVAQVRSLDYVDSVGIENNRMHVIARRAEPVVRQLLAADPDLCELEVRRAGLSEVFTDVTSPGLSSER